jgi:valyl-tRNA synthetase
LWWGHRIPAWYAPSGEFVVAHNLDSAFDKFAEKGISVECENSMEIPRLPRGYYFCGKAFEKGSFFNTTHQIQVFDPAKLKFVIRDVNGWKLLDEIYYDDELLDGRDNSSTRTTGSEFFVEKSQFDN